MKILGMVGTAGQGKDTFADYLQEYLEGEHHVVRIALADFMKKGLATAFNLPVEVMYDRVAKETPLDILGGKTPRYALQKFGTEFAQGEFRKDIWPAVMSNYLATLEEQPDFVIITDIRFDMELNWCRDNNAELYFIHRNFELEQKHWFLKFIDKCNGKAVHSSEAGLYNKFEAFYDNWIDNRGPMLTLQRKAKEISKELSTNCLPRR